MKIYTFVMSLEEILLCLQVLLLSVQSVHADHRHDTDGKIEKPEQIETDPQFTKDGVIVLMHDSTINRTCRYEDGTVIEKPLRVCDLTYDELLN